MSFAQKTNAAFEQFTAANRPQSDLHIGQLEHALDLKNPQQTDGLVDAVSSRLHLDTLSSIDQRLFASRVIGGLSVRLAVASMLVAENSNPAESFETLSSQDQSDALHDVAVLYANAAEQSLDETGGTTIDLLGEAAANIGPLPAVEHQLVRDQLYAAKSAQRTRKDRRRDLLSYINVLPGTYPPGSFRSISVGTPDSLLVQAFGRNDVLDRELPAIRDARASLGDDIVMMEYLRDEQFDTGDSNRALAKAVAEKVYGGDVVEPVIQWEVAYALWQSDPEKFEQYKNYMHVVYPRSSFYPTYEVKADSIKVMDTLGMNNPLELAHQDMAVRAMAILAKQGVRAELLEADIPFDPRSTQLQVRGPGSWMMRETLTRVEHVLRSRVTF